MLSLAQNSLSVFLINVGLFIVGVKDLRMKDVFLLDTELKETFTLFEGAKRRLANQKIHFIDIHLL